MSAWQIGMFTTAVPGVFEVIKHYSQLDGKKIAAALAGNQQAILVSLSTSQKRCPLPQFGPI